MLKEENKSRQGDTQAEEEVFSVQYRGWNEGLKQPLGHLGERRLGEAGTGGCLLCLRKSEGASTAGEEEAMGRRNERRPERLGAGKILEDLAGQSKDLGFCFQ